MSESTFANSTVLEFYKELPFNIRESVEASADVVRQTDYLTVYPVLRPLMRAGLRILEVGCGTGWLSNSLAYHHRAIVTGIDFNPVAVERARSVAAALSVDIKFVADDLFLFDPPVPYDLVVSLGVLHHTDNCMAAVQRVCDKFVRPGGHILIGLYHTYGRKPLLEHFQALKHQGATEQEMLERYRQLHSQITDETMLVSWFRDQVLHPHETQHTLEEVVPVLHASGMELLSTSINRFQPIDSLAGLYNEERKHYELGVQRLKENKYFTGFFVFMARKSCGIARDAKSSSVAGGGLTSRTAPLDTKPYVEYHPVFGYHYVRDTKLELPRPGGGHYTVQINSQGIRSDKEYSFRKRDGVRRIIVCGDSMAAGQFVSNTQRFSELLERSVPNLEVINLALEGSGTDQQVLLYEHIGLKYEHDLVLLLPFLQNIRRNLVEWREGIDAKTGQMVLRAKPRFEFVDGELVLRNVPVPKEPPSDSARQLNGTDTSQSWLGQLKASISSLPGASHFKKAFYALVPWEPFPEYRDPGSREWRLMSAIIHRFKELAGSRTLVVAPTFYASYVRFSMARNYWDRYASLGTTPGIHVIDLLPHFRRMGKHAVKCFQEPYDMHFSAYGNLVLADALQEELSRLGEL